MAGHSRAPRYAVDPKSGCWIWQRSRFGNGYGQDYRDGKCLPAHRVAYEDAHGPIPAGYDIDHLCRTPLCVNPAHLEAVTRRENARRGLRTKLDAAKVRAIRAAVGSNREVARAFGVHNSLVSRVRSRKAWADVD